MNAISNYMVDGRKATNEDRLRKLKEIVDNGDDVKASQLLDMAYETVTVGNMFAEEATEILARYGVVEKKIKTTANNLMQSFGAFDKAMRELLNTKAERDQMCANVDILRELLEAFCHNAIEVERGAYYKAKLFLPRK